MNAGKIIDDALIRMGEDPDLCMWESGGESSRCTLRQRMMLMLEEAAAKAVGDTPVDKLTGWKPLDNTGLTVLPDGTGILPLPGDFLRFLYLRMTGWERKVDCILPAAHWLHRLQLCRWKGLRGTPQRPLVFQGVSDGAPALELYSCKPGDKVTEGWYMPAPKINEAGEIEIPPAAYSRLLDLLASPES